MKKQLIIFCAGLALMTCSHDNVSLPPVANFSWSDGLDRILLDGSASVNPNNDQLTYRWTVSPALQVNYTSGMSSSYVMIPENNISETSVDVTLAVKNGTASSSITHTVQMPAWNLSRSYGLGRALVDEKSNDVAYEWYEDQGNSGTWSGVNCGPSSATMAIEWMHPDFKGTPEDARNVYHPEGGWWSTTDIAHYLQDNESYSYYINFTSTSDLKQEIDKGNIVILCLDMSYVSAETNGQYRLNKFYSAESRGWGHFIVVKGYKDISMSAGDEPTLYMEVYDPFNFGATYATDGSSKGKNRYYTATDLLTATTNWWAYAIVISKESTSGGRIGLPESDVPEQSGR